MSDLATLETQGKTATLTLNRPDARNALSLGLLTALRDRLRELATCDDVRVCVMQGAGPAWCAGMDLKELLETPANAQRLLSQIAEATIELRGLPMATICRAHGAAIGGGCGLMCVCDFAITHADSKIGYPEVDLGVCPAVVAPWLIQRIGAGAARRVLIQGGLLSGEQAGELGMAAVVQTRQELDDAVQALVDRLAAAGPTALRATKLWLNELSGEELSKQVRRGAVISAEVTSDPEAQRRLRAMFARR